VEVISIADDFFVALGLRRYELKINSMGDEVWPPGLRRTLAVGPPRASSRVV